MICRCILPDWACKEFPNRKKVIEGNLSETQLTELNSNYYNIYYFPNYPSLYEATKIIDGSQVDIFNWVFVDMDLKDEVYKDKESFVEILDTFSLRPTKIVDSGNGVHAYWHIADLDVMSYLKLQRRLCRYFRTDEAVGKICQVMRLPGYVNTKKVDNVSLCTLLKETTSSYTCEQLDNVLPRLSKEDEEYCRHHYERTYDSPTDVKVNDKLPVKFAKLVQTSPEVKAIWQGNTSDRSVSDYRLGHIMFAHGFSKDDALSVLVNSAKALERAPTHRINYATNIVDKIWTYEITENKEELTLSSTVKEILAKSGDTAKGTRFPCWSYIDATYHGFRLGQVIGLVAGSGVGKTTIALNMFLGFVQNNPGYEHFFIPLEQPANEIADRWKTLCQGQEHLYEKVHIISNYSDEGQFRNLSFSEIKDYLLKFQKTTGKKVGCVVIDHIGALKKKGQDGENQDLMTVCHEMKAFAIQTNTLLVMQSQSSREKAGIGDLELNKDAAYGTVYFESYCDYLITIWQPLKRCYSEPGCPTVTAFKFCKIRHKKIGQDALQEDVCYRLFLDGKSEYLRTLTQDEEKAFNFFNTKATNKRKQDRKTDLVEYTSITWVAD